MHLVFISHEYPLWSPGGVGSFLQTFGRALVQKGHRVSIVGAGNSSAEEVLEDKGVNLYRLPRKKGFILAFLHNGIQLNKKLKQLHKEHPIDIIESAELGLALLSGSHPAKKVIRLHGGHHFFAEAEKRGINWRKGLLEKRSFKKADAFIAVSNYVKSHTETYLSYHNKPVEIINHPLDTSTPIPQVAVKENHILFAGTVCEKKGVRQLIEAFKIVRGQYPLMVLDIFGRDWFFPNGDSYIEMLKSTYNGSYFENVVFHGSIPKDELNTRYAEAAFCVFPSHMETQGLVTLEAMLLQKPVIFSQYGPGPETIAPMQTGLLCDVYRPADIAEKMIWCIQHPEEAKKLGIKAAETVRTHYDINTILEKNLTFYSKLLQ
ncbi:glycosyltransferase involved in cell wall biosynthesis [Ulvibacter sp. MAR_2010_11]|uniref:glycosyltransferase family 4 protein n=1 Tax=Ulvibacter sp. MAR_2010_11 TaxID=1250229 RepID=UPI000C2CAD1A|nr:glycosyltransferase family 4 protein [Ulvibacter sp. MAR_2010_11]PKA82108.1 glycosyltransferase involved in cell wall biosynthesis [Ulvibacter sp. MAR_2010_11]